MSFRSKEKSQNIAIHRDTCFVSRSRWLFHVIDFLLVEIIIELNVMKDSKTTEINHKAYQLC